MKQEQVNGTDPLHCIIYTCPFSIVTCEGKNVLSENGIETAYLIIVVV